MKIGISIDGVLRNFIAQFIYTYDKYINKTDIEESDVTSMNLLEFFEFKDLDSLNKFIYSEAPLEIFGHADQVSDGIVNQFNNFLLDMDYDGEHEIELVSREVDKSIPATFFFLSKTGARPTNIRFVKTHADEWNSLDVLITAHPKTLAEKPSGKISVKVKTQYNNNSNSDYEIDSLSEFMLNENLRLKILEKPIITNYEEIN